MDYISKELFIKKMEKKPYTLYLGKYYCVEKEFAETITIGYSNLIHQVIIGINEEACIGVASIKGNTLQIEYGFSNDIVLDLDEDYTVIEDYRVYGIWVGRYLYVIYLA